MLREEDLIDDRHLNAALTPPGAERAERERVMRNGSPIVAPELPSPTVTPPTPPPVAATPEVSSVPPAAPIAPKRRRRRATDAEDGVRMVDVRATRPQFVWWPYIPSGCLTIVEGEPGSKKSFLVLQFAADVTRGRSILGTDPCLPARKVLLLSAEDDLGATVKRRLDAMDADQERLIAVTRDLNLAQEEDRAHFERLLRKHAPALVIVDTMSVYLQVADSKARPVLAKLAALASKYRTAIVLVRHLRKAGGNAINRGYGSIHYIGAVRSAIGITRNPLDASQSVVVHSKSNLSETGPLVVFRITNGALARVIDSPLTPQDLLKPRQQERLEEAQLFLREALAEGARPAEEVKAEATAAGISHATLRRARLDLGVVVVKGGNRGPWTWALPDDLEDAHA